MAALFGIRSEQPKSLIPCIKVSANIDTYLTSFTIHLNMSSVFVPSTTAAVAFTYPDYHAVGDEWQKIDYDNMAKVDRMLALGTLMMADATSVPRWNQDNSRTESYRGVSAR